MYKMYEKLQAGVETADKVADIYGYPACWYALANNNTNRANSTKQAESWCSLALGLSKEWEVCENVFSEINAGKAACTMTINECQGLTETAGCEPLAGECLSHCDGKGNCTKTVLATLLEDPDICGSSISSMIKYALFDLPWGPVVQLGYAMLSVLLTFILGSQLSIVDCVGAVAQSCLLLRALWIGQEMVGTAPNGTCSFLLLNTQSLSTAATVCLMAMLGPLVALGSEWSADKKERATSTGKLVLAGLLLLLPLVANVIFFGVAIAGAFSLLIAAFPALVGFLHVVFVQGILLFIVL
jgi:hypothetical protein